MPIFELNQKIEMPFSYDINESILNIICGGVTKNAEKIVMSPRLFMLMFTWQVHDTYKWDKTGIVVQIKKYIQLQRQEETRK